MAEQTRVRQGTDGDNAAEANFHHFQSDACPQKANAEMRQAERRMKTWHEVSFSQPSEISCSAGAGVGSVSSSSRHHESVYKGRAIALPGR